MDERVEIKVEISVIDETDIKQEINDESVLFHHQFEIKDEPVEIEAEEESDDTASDQTDVAIKEYKCTVCEESYEDLYSLQIHSKCHTGETPYKCDACGAGFALR